MKTAVSLPDAVFEQVERLARKTKRTRSEVYAEALIEYLARHSGDSINEAMDATLERVGVVKDEFAAAAARKTLQAVTW